MSTVDYFERNAYDHRKVEACYDCKTGYTIASIDDIVKIAVDSEVIGRRDDPKKVRYYKQRANTLRGRFVRKMLLVMCRMVVMNLLLCRSRIVSRKIAVNTLDLLWLIGSLMFRLRWVVLIWLVLMVSSRLVRVVMMDITTILLA